MSDKIKYINADEWRREVLECTRPVVVDFYSTECPPCEALAAKYDALSELYGDDVAFVKVFRQDNRDLAQSLGISGSPTVVFFRDGVPVGDTLTGGIRRRDLERNLHALLPSARVTEIKAGEPRVSSDWDVLILGGGPAGLAAAIYTAQAKLRTVVVDKGLSGGNVSITHQVSNYPGFVEPQPGFLLAHYMAEQAKGAGAVFREAVDVTDVDLSKREVVLDGLETLRARKIIVATGSSPRPLGIPGEAEYKGKGVSYCATCDAKYSEGKHVVVIGGGNTAIEESLFIQKFAAKITVVHQFDKLQANRQAADRALSSDRIRFLFSHEPRAFVASGKTVDQVLVEDLKTGVQHHIDCDGVFVFVGMQPNLSLFSDVFSLDDWGYVKVDEEMRTGLPDVFAAGDIVHKTYRQITTAVSDGTIAAMAISRELGA